MSFFNKTRSWYGRYERPISSISLISGFIFDILTLKRVDTFWENSWIIAHLLIVGLFIVLIHIREAEEGDEKNPTKVHFWYVNILQFFFGGLLSTFLVFYFRSADIFVAWPFILLLVAAFVANESMKHHYTRFTFQMSLFFLSIYSFAIFFIPILLHKIGDWVFILSGVISLAVITLFTLILLFFAKEKTIKNKKVFFTTISCIFIFVNFLYFTNLIPPIPLSLKDAGIYNSVQRNNSGNYDVTYEDYGWKKYFKFYQDFKEVPGSPIYAYSAVFSPKDLNLQIVHEWQHYDNSRKKWITESLINLSVSGGRDGGFRTYSMRYNLEQGKWRVNIKTKQDQIIGTLRFNINIVNEQPLLVNDTK